MEKYLSSAGNFLAVIIGAIFMPVFEFMYGQGEAVMYTMTALIFFLVMDWIAGIRASKKDGTYASKYGIDGVFRSFFILLLPAGGHLLDMVLGAPGVLFGLLAFGVLYHIIQSMTANSIRAGWGEWVPEGVLNKITEWVQAELEAKMTRSQQRKGEVK